MTVEFRWWSRAARLVFAGVLASLTLVPTVGSANLPYPTRSAYRIKGM